MTHPLQRLVATPKLRDQPLRILLFVLPELERDRAVPIKQQYVAQSLKIHQQQVSRTLRTLVAEGLLELGPNDGASKTYKPNMKHPALAVLYNGMLYN